MLIIYFEISFISFLTKPGGFFSLKIKYIEYWLGSNLLQHAIDRRLKFWY